MSFWQPSVSRASLRTGNAQESTSWLILALGSWPENTSSNFCLYRSSCLRLSVPVSLASSLRGFLSFFLFFFFLSLFCFFLQIILRTHSLRRPFIFWISPYSRDEPWPFYVLTWEPERQPKAPLHALVCKKKKSKTNRLRTAMNFSNTIIGRKIIVPASGTSLGLLAESCLMSPQTTWGGAESRNTSCCWHKLSLPADSLYVLKASA